MLKSDMFGRSSSIATRIPLFFLAAACVAILPAELGWAQPAVGGLNLAEVSGKLEAAVANQIKIKSDDDKEYMIVVEPSETKLKYEGTADPKFLMPGLFVRFTAAFDQQAKLQSPLAEIEIFTPVQQPRMRRDQMQDQTPGIYAVEPKEGQAAAPAGFTYYRIVGKLGAVQADKMQVIASKPLIVELDPAAKITVSGGDATFFVTGDTVQVTGTNRTGQEGWIQAETVVVTGAKPLAPSEKPVRNGRTTRGKAKAVPGKLGGDKNVKK